MCSFFVGVLRNTIFFLMNFKERIWDENTMMAREDEECTLFCRQDVEYYEFLRVRCRMKITCWTMWGCILL